MVEQQHGSATRKFAQVLKSEVVLGSLIGILSILTAFASYQSSLAGGDETQANIDGLAVLADSNAEYLSANQLLIYDYSMYDGFFLHEGEDEFRAEFYRANFSEALDRAYEADPENPFTDIYYDEFFSDAETLYADGIQRFEDAQRAGEKSNAYQEAMLIMAVGLSFSAWASLLPDRSQMRLLFVILGIVALVVGLGSLAGAG